MNRSSREPVYMISVAARMVACHPQTLRMYEREGLVSPYRSKRNLRLYSDEDIERIRMIKRLTQELGVNLAGVEVILELLEKIDQQQNEIERLQRELREERKALNPAPVQTTGYVVEIENRENRQ
ncbi:MAG: heat shock protein transcriptional repressor HspR [Candidatus Zipacnadales bacterium]